LIAHQACIGRPRFLGPNFGAAEPWRAT
jgi:hypothetical protein